MLPGATRSRAAILCFGGWGLQTMLHLAPRLQAAQEQRIATGIDGPDLTRITRFAALLPSDHLDQQGELDLSLFTLRDSRLPPFYLERLLHKLDRSRKTAAGGHAAPLAASQRRASQFLDAVGETLVPLQWQANAGRRGNDSSPRRGLPWPFRRPSKDEESDDALGGMPPAAQTAHDPPTRRHAFRAGLQAGDHIAHLVASNIIDPIRADTHVPGDPFVQTTLYVIAPLFEPLTSALIWPTIAHQLNYLGQRHIAQVVGIFAAGSYATDSSRVIEDATCYAAMAELEALTGLRPVNLAKFTASMRQDLGKRGTNRGSLPEEWLGHQLFDRIYLVDREKSNQGLARNSYELSVLVSNALQSLITADGAAYIDEQVGIDLRNAGERPYSLLGAAADYLPIDYLLQTAQENEGKRLLRELVLPTEAAGGAVISPPPAAPNMEPLTPLQELGATSQQVLTQLTEQMPHLFNELSPQSVEQISVHPSYILPNATARKLRGLDPVRWQASFDSHLHEILAQFEESTDAGALDSAWGLAALRENGLSQNASDARFLPAIAVRMRTRLLTLLGSQPAGIVHARRQLHQWLYELGLERHALSSFANDVIPKTGAGHAERQLELRDWRARYMRTLGDQPSLFGSMTRAGGLLSGIVLLTLLYLFGSGLAGNIDAIVASDANAVALMGLMDEAFAGAIVDFIESEANAATFIGLMLGAFLGAMISFRARLRRVRALRRERVNLARSELTGRLQEGVQRGLGRVHERLQQMLQQMDRVLEETCELLQDWSVSEALPPLPPAEVTSTHLYRPHLNSALWERCQAFMRSRQDAEGRHGEGRLREIWTSPQRRDRLAALFTGQHDNTQRGEGQRGLAQSLAAYVRRSAQDAVAAAPTETPEQAAGGGRAFHEDENLAARREFVRTLARDYNLEHLLWRDIASSEDFTSFSPEGTFTPVSAATLRYLEEMWSVAKPAANYDVSDRLAAYGLPVEFAAVSGDPDSDLTEGVMQSLRIPRLLTGDPFQITFVRTLHGLELNDLGSMARYMAELGRLNPAARQQVLLADAIDAELYNQQRP